MTHEGRSPRNLERARRPHAVKGMEPVDPRVPHLRRGSSPDCNRRCVGRQSSTGAVSLIGKHEGVATAVSALRR